MNKEIIKAMNKKPTTLDTFRKWWNKNGYKVMRVLLFPVWAVVWSYEKAETHFNRRTEWSDERAAEILNYYIPRVSKWDAEEKHFWFFDNGMGWNMKYTVRKYIKLRDRRFWKLYASAWGYKMRDYLVNSFELEGFDKEVLDSFDTGTEIIFTMREN